MAARAHRLPLITPPGPHAAHAIHGDDSLVPPCPESATSDSCTGVEAEGWARWVDRVNPVRRVRSRQGRVAPGERPSRPPPPAAPSRAGRCRSTPAVAVVASPTRWPAPCKCLDSPGRRSYLSGCGPRVEEGSMMVQTCAACGDSCESPHDRRAQPAARTRMPVAQWPGIGWPCPRNARRACASGSCGTGSGCRHRSLHLSRSTDASGSVWQARSRATASRWASLRRWRSAAVGSCPDAPSTVVIRGEATGQRDRGRRQRLARGGAQARPVPPRRRRPRAARPPAILATRASKLPHLTVEVRAVRGHALLHLCTAA